MSEEQKRTHQKRSKLDRYTIAFEYNKQIRITRRKHWWRKARSGLYNLLIVFRRVFTFNASKLVSQKDINSQFHTVVLLATNLAW